MTTLKKLSGLLLGLAFCIFLTATPSAQVIPQAKKPDTKITPILNVEPEFLFASKDSSMFLLISNGNLASNQTIQAGDSFRITIDSLSGTVTEINPAVFIN